MDSNEAFPEVSTIHLRIDVSSLKSSGSPIDCSLVLKIEALSCSPKISPNTALGGFMAVATI
jgi:hypothetical protein